MCVPAVVDSDIAEVVVDTKDSFIQTTVIGHDDQVLLEDKFVYGRVNDDYDSIHVSRVLGGGQLWTAFDMSIDYNADGYYAASPVKVSDVRGLPTTVVKHIVNAVMGQRYEAAEVNLTRYKAVDTIVFRDKVLVDDMVANQKKGLEEALPAPKLEYAELG